MGRYSARIVGEKMQQAPQRNIWDEVSGISLPRHWMGAWLSYRKLASLQQLPNSDYRAQLAGLYPLEYAFFYSLTKTNATGDQRVTVMQDWFLLGATIFATQDGASALPGSSVKAQIYVGRYQQGVALTDRPTVGSDQFGGIDRSAVLTATKDGMLARYLRVPLWIPPNTPVLIRVQNQDTSNNTNSIEITLQGCGR